MKPDTALGRLVATLAVTALTGLAAAACTGPGASTSEQSGQVLAAADREPVAPLRAELVAGGGEYDLAQHSGEVIVINFWASWCGPCVVEADDLEQTYQATKDLRVSFVGINTRDQRDSAKQFLVGRSSYPSVFDPAGRLALGFQVAPTAIPTTIVIDRRGRVAAIWHGAVLRSSLEPVVREIAEENSP